MIKYNDKKEILHIIFESHLHDRRVIEQLLNGLEVYIRFEVAIELTADSGNLQEYLELISNFKRFCDAYDIKYFMVEAFDSQLGYSDGWWAVKNGSDPSNPKLYIEKEAEYSGRDMWYPSPIILPGETKMVFTTSPLVLIGLTAAGLFFLISSVVGCVIFIRYKKLRRNLTNEEVIEFMKGRPTIPNGESTTICAADSKEFDSAFDLSMSDLIIDSSSILGIGNFGTVLKGTVKGVPAAIKQPNKDCPKGTFKSVLSEVKVLCYIGIHSNVVGFLGAYTKEIQQGILFLATELCAKGSLEKLLRTKRSVISKQEANRYQPSQLEHMLCFDELHRFSKEIASGMQYIESKQIVHGDLSARNILLDEHFTCKIGDFGLSRKLYEYQKYVKKSQEPLPWKWMAVESLAKMEFTSKSDVWSFGVTIWEIYSLGDCPYGGLNWSVEFVDQLRNGLRLTIPQFASQAIFEIMLKCWDLDTEQRPQFTELVDSFRQLNDSEYMDLSET